MMDLIDREEVHDIIAMHLSDYMTDETRLKLEMIDCKIEDCIPTVQAVPIEEIQTLINDIEVMRTSPALIDNDEVQRFAENVLYALNRLVKESDAE